MDTPEETFRNRIFRSATFEGRADADGTPNEQYLKLYKDLAQNGVQHIITGCTIVSPEGRMVQPAQAGIDSDDKIDVYRKVTEAVHQFNAKIYLQISHAGRQTTTAVTGLQVVGASDQKSPYFRSKPKQLTRAEIKKVIDSFAAAALRAKLAGFDGIQIHAAHGYLVHQFLHPYINNRTDEYGINRQTGIGEQFLHEIIAAVRVRCGENFPVLVKVSASDDLRKPFSESNFISLIQMLHKEKVYAIEISYGTMEDALNIFRGESVPVEQIFTHNFRYKKQNELSKKIWKLLVLPFLQRRLIKFSENYNLPYSELAKSQTDIPIICVGGWRKGSAILDAIATKKTDYISLCRPFICEPDFISKLCKDNNYNSQCVNCNTCAIMCDSGNPTRCYKR